MFCPKEVKIGVRHNLQSVYICQRPQSAVGEKVKGENPICTEL